MPCGGAAGMLRVMRRFAPLLLLAACGGPAPATDGRWFGTMQPDLATAGCQPGRASLVVTRNAALFTPDEGTRTLEGTATPDSAITAERTTTGADKKPYATRFAARLADGTITGTYTTPRCRYAVTLKGA